MEAWTFPPGLMIPVVCVLNCILHLCSWCTQSKESHEHKSNSSRLLSVNSIVVCYSALFVLLFGFMGPSKVFACSWNLDTTGTLCYCVTSSEYILSQKKKKTIFKSFVWYSSCFSVMICRWSPCAVPGPERKQCRMMNLEKEMWQKTWIQSDV